MQSFRRRNLTEVLILVIKYFWTGAENEKEAVQCFCLRAPDSLSLSFKYPLTAGASRRDQPGDCVVQMVWWP